jgi:membrane protease YdiL (CAAX protease family)
LAPRTNEATGEVKGKACGGVAGRRGCLDHRYLTIGLDPKKRPQHVLVKYLKNHPQPFVVAILLVAAVVVAPVVEELLFRGFLMRQIDGALGPMGAIILSSAVFGVVHLGSIPLVLVPPYMLLGAVLGVVAYVTNSIRASMAVHAAQNGFATGMALGKPLLALGLVLGALTMQFVVFAMLSSKLTLQSDRQGTLPLL